MRIPVSGDFTGSLTAPPAKDWTTKGNILHIKDAEGAGLVTGDIIGSMAFTGTFSVNLKTGLGRGHGKWILTSTGYAYGTFEGTWIADITDVTNIAGSFVGQGTGVYEGMKLNSSFTGHNLYLAGYEGTNGIYFEWDGTILSTKGTGLP